MYRDIENIIETEIRPRFQAHGGDIEPPGAGDGGTLRGRLIGKCISEPVGH
jgi:Fe-S cluster biogenesis protein NfuA